MQAQGTALLPHEYDGLGDVFRRTIKHEGVRGLFKGLTPNLLKVLLLLPFLYQVAPSASITYLVYTNVCKAFGLN
jgi:solute carrier family 25 (mitochondrial phosphate transporter), member 23/24/25/41